MKYNGERYDSPVKEDELLLEAASGEILESQLNEAAYANKNIRRISFCNGDILELSLKEVENIISRVHYYFPECRVISMHSSVSSIKNKTDDELKHLKNLGVNDIYINHETGNPEVLAYINDGHTVRDSIEQMARLNKAGIRHIASIVIGLGGHGLAEECAIDTAGMLSRIKPSMIIFNRLKVCEWSEIYEDVKEGRFIEAEECEILIEEKTIIENIDLPDTYLSSKEVSGYLGKDRKHIIETFEDRLKLL
ncbi:MAG: radical SAM protein [Clostridium sp.]|nr:radical SAM protein [Clostridium sp.]